jgi:hypothetical protein
MEQHLMVGISVVSVLATLPVVYYARAVRRRLGRAKTKG